MGKIVIPMKNQLVIDEKDETVKKDKAEEPATHILSLVIVASEPVQDSESGRPLLT